MRFHENEEAVSPVIGVILMVAITVILAAVIAVFVFGMAGEVQSTKSIGVSVKLDDADVVITYQGGSDANSVQYLKFIVETVEYWSDNSTTGVQQTGAPGDVPYVGQKFTITHGGTAGSIDVTTIAKFADGTEQVIYDGTL
ncbi:MAG: type IV pilin N-terminal domain-containing protein [Methanomicrobiaceae archaeon]|nr:type IV pilin N-terminal domain-containing protein [Methanomicrobiaceae archaeon]